MTITDTQPGLVGRSQVIADVRAALDDPAGFGAMLVGEAGVGKTAVAHAVVGRLQWTAPVLRVTGGSSLRTIAFGALAPYLHSLSASDVQSPVAILRAIMEHLAAEGQGRPQHLPLIVIDDAHELDDSSRTLITQLITARRAKVLVMIRTSQTAPPDFGTLSADGLLARFDLDPLDADEVDLLCTQILGGPVLTGTSHALAAVTGGNPLFLRTFLDQAKDSGQLRSLNGVWRLDADQSMVQLQLGDLIRSQLRSRDRDDLRALEVVALAEPIALEVVAQCIDPGILQRLLDERLLTLGPGADQPVSLEHPLYGDVLRGQVPAARSMAIRRSVLEVMDEESQSLQGFLRSVSWGLDCGLPADDRTLLRAAVVANGLRDHDLALRAVRAVSEPGLRGHALTETARVHAGRGNLVYAQELVDEALRRCTDLGVAKDATLLSFELKLKAGGSSEDLRADVERWRSLIAEVGPLEGGDDLELTRFRLGCTILDCHVLVLEGRYSGVEDTLRTVAAAPQGTEETRAVSLVLLAELLGSMGRAEEGITFSAEALDIIESAGPRLLNHRENAAARHVFLLSNLGRPEEAKETLRSHSQKHPRSLLYFAGWGDFVDGVTALRSARNRQARDRFLLALEALRDTDTVHVRTLLVGLIAYASALAGDGVRAQTLIDEFELMPNGGSRAMRLGGRIFITAADAMVRDPAAAHADLVRLAGAAEKDQMRDLAATGLRLSLLLGDTSAITPFIRVLEGLEGRGAEILLDFARAALAKDVDAMIEAAHRAGEIGNTAFEFAGLSLAQQYMAGQTSGRRARAVQRRLVVLGELREGPVPQPLAAVSAGAAAPSLTPTERKIVALVKEGYSNRDIAEQKNVSVRTVEGHLYRIFAKLGVNRREDLRTP